MQSGLAFLTEDPLQTRGGNHLPWGPEAWTSNSHCWAVGSDVSAPTHARTSGVALGSGLVQVPFQTITVRVRDKYHLGLGVLPISDPEYVNPATENGLF